MADDRDLFGELKIFGLRERESVVNAVDRLIQDLNVHLQAHPGPMDPLTGATYIVWERRTMMKIGVVQGWVNALSSVGILPFEVSERLKHRAVAMINRAAASVQMGQRQ